MKGAVMVFRVWTNGREICLLLQVHIARHLAFPGQTQSIARLANYHRAKRQPTARPRRLAALGSNKKLHAGTPDMQLFCAAETASIFLRRR